MLLIFGCVGQRNSTLSSALTAPSTAPTSPPGVSLHGIERAANLPRLPGADSPVSIFRAVSDNQEQILGDASVASAGANNHVDPVSHTLALVPGGEEDLGWAVYTLPGLDANRPVTCTIQAAPIVPGGEEELGFWVFYSDYSQSHWELAAGPNPDASFSGPATLTLNSASMRERVVSAKGFADPTFSYAIVTKGSADNSTAKAYDQQPRIEIAAGDTTLRSTADPAYFKTAPLPSVLSGVTCDPHTGLITAHLEPALSQGADLVYLERREAGAAGAWTELGLVPANSAQYNDPEDNTSGSAPLPGHTYDYRAVAASTDGALELRASYSNQLAATEPTNLLPTAELQVDQTAIELGAAVSFDASASTDLDGTVADYQWDLDGNGIYNETGPESAARGVAQPASWTYSNFGIYTASVRVSDNSGGTDVASQAITVNAPPVADLQADATSGNPPFNVTFDASSSHDPDGTIADYEWDFDGNGVYNEAGAEQMARGNPVPSSYMYTAPGSYAPRVRVTDNKGATSQASVNEVARGWLLLAIDTPGDVGSYTTLKVVNGRPAISYRDTTNNALKFAYSARPDGSGDWTSLTVDATGNDGFFTSLAVVNARPAIGYYDNTFHDLKYAWSSLADGSSGWTSITVDATNGAGQYASLALINGKPAIAYYNATVQDLEYAYSNTVDGSSGWNTLTIDAAGNAGSYASMTTVNGKPAICYYAGGLKYARSTMDDGSSGWTTIYIDASGFMGTYNSLAVVNGKPAVTHYDGATFDLKYAYSSAIDGSSGWNWLQADTTGNVGQFTSLAVVHGCPAASFWDVSNTQLRYASSSTADGSSGWSSMAVDATGDQVGEYDSLAVLSNGSPAISYYDATNGDLRFAVLFE